MKASLVTSAPYARSTLPLNIAHRGLSSLIPENTIPAFETAMFAGADFIELDVVFSKDDHLVVMHDPYLHRITDVAHNQLQ